MAVLAMFPLGTVLLPGGVLPLHVFEPRYRQLVIDCLGGHGRPRVRGDVDRTGSEVGGGDQRADVGTVARITRVDALEDGRYSVVAVGTRRIRVQRVAAGRSVPARRCRRLARRRPRRRPASPVEAAVGVRRVGRCSRRRPTRRIAIRHRGPDRQRRPAPRVLPPGRIGPDRSRRPLPAAVRSFARRSDSSCSVRPSMTWRRCCGSAWRDTRGLCPRGPPKNGRSAIAEGNVALGGSRGRSPRP